MKKFMMGAATLALTLVIGGSVFTGGPATAEAAAKKSVHCAYTTGKTCNFVDKNKDGLCDNCKGKKNGTFVDKNKDGICDNHKKHNPNCKNNGKKQKVNKKISNGHHSNSHGGHGNSHH